MASAGDHQHGWPRPPGPEREARTPHGWRPLASVVTALVSVGVALALPAAAPSVARSDRSGPAGVVDQWPGARIVDLPGRLSDGSAFEPWLVIAGTTAVGIARSTSETSSRLVLHMGTAAPAILQNFTGADPPILAALTYAGGQIFWLRIEGNGAHRTTVWRYRVGYSVPEQIASEPGEPDYNHSQYDLEVDNGRLYWTTSRSDRSTDIHSVSIDGGTVDVETLAGSYQLTNPPWVVKAPTRTLGTQAGGRGADVEMLNLNTHAHMTATATPDQFLTCTPAWCRITTDQGGEVAYYAEHPDGTARRRIGNGALVPINTDAALLDRFEVLGEPNATGGGFSRLWLDDLANDRTVLLDDNATDTVESRGGYIWWSSTGASADWHVLDLHQLS